MYENDNYISKSSTSGQPMKQAVSDASAAGASIIMTVPIAGWVSADESGPCDPHPASDSVIAQHFLPMLPSKGAAFAYPPDKNDGKVYADEFVAWLEGQFPDAQTDPQRRIFYMLDNEPDLWSSTHSEIHPDPVTYDELVKKSTDFATAIKAAAPAALVFGPASYGWNGYINLQNAPDANGRDFIEYYLDAMKAAEASAGTRLLDVLDVHWYPEAQGGGRRIVDDGTSADEVAARLQAPRSLWDPGYTEDSWITKYSTNGPIALIPLLQKKIDAHYPGTKLSFSEYYYGGGGHISGGIAQADVLGVFGRENVFAATMWEGSGMNAFIFGAFAMFRNYDGQGATFGDTSIEAQSSDVEQSAVYASTFASDPTKVIVVALNKQGNPLKAGITLAHPVELKATDVYTLTSAGSTPVKQTAIAAVATNAFNYEMPPFSVSTLVFHP
jgi:Glycoside hydrolase family 44